MRAVHLDRLRLYEIPQSREIVAPVAGYAIHSRHPFLADGIRQALETGSPGRRGAGAFLLLSFAFLTAVSIPQTRPGYNVSKTLFPNKLPNTFVNVLTPRNQTYRPCLVWRGCSCVACVRHVCVYHRLFPSVPRRCACPHQARAYSQRSHPLTLKSLQRHLPHSPLPLPPLPHFKGAMGAAQSDPPAASRNNHPPNAGHFRSIGFNSLMVSISIIALAHLYFSVFPQL